MSPEAAWFIAGACFSVGIAALAVRILWEAAERMDRKDRE